MVQVIGPDGFPVWVEAPEAVGQRSIVTGKAVTGAERQALSFYNRAKDALETIEAPEADGKSLEQVVGNAPLGKQAQAKYAPNVLQTPAQKRYRQAQRAFTEARLRKESGAAIPTHEYTSDAQTYFAQPGDDPTTIEQKRRQRRTVLDGLRFASGRAYDEFYGVTQPEPVGATAERKPAPGAVDQTKVDEVWRRIQERRKGKK